MTSKNNLAWMPIQLTQGLYALVDGKDYEQLNKHNWYVNKIGNTYYAMKHTPAQNGKQGIILMHRVILGLSKGVEADHRNGCGLDNRRVNLRPATRNQNQWNRRPQVKTSKYKGVSWNKGAKKWKAQIRFDSKKIHLGYFDSEIEAAKAYGRKAKEMFGEFARINY